MADRYSEIFSNKTTPQTQPIPGTAQVQNNAGGFSWKLEKWDQLTRFLVLGSAGGTYYVTPRKLTLENAQVVIDCIKEDGVRAVREIVDVSLKGRAPKQDPGIFALALACTHGDAATKRFEPDVDPELDEGYRRAMETNA